MKFITNQKELFSNHNIKLGTVEECLLYFKDKEEIEVDTETTGFDPYTCKLLTLQLGNFEEQFVIDVSTVDIKLFKPLLESGKLIILQNAQFDFRFLYHNGIDVKNIYDTYLAEALLTAGYGDEEDIKVIGKEAERKLGLGDLTKKYCNVELDKSIRGDINRVGLTTRVIQYAADDVKYLGKIKEKQLVEINRLGLNAVLDLENSVVRVFSLMSYNGVKVDVGKWKTVSRGIAEESLKLQQKLDELVLKESCLKRFVVDGVQLDLFGGRERMVNVNWGSPKQKLNILNALGLNVDSTGAEVLYKNKNKHEIVSTLIEYNKVTKLKSSFGDKFLKNVNKVTGRVHPNYFQILSTGRISVNNPNVNQIPSKGELGPVIRSAFVPEKGNKMVGGDYTGMELAIIAEFSKDPVWVNALKEGKNLHTELCKITFNIPEDKVKEPFPYKETMTYRDVQKTVDFGLAYGMSKYKLSSTIGVLLDIAEQTINDFFSKVPNVKSFLDKLALLGWRRGYIRTPKPYNRIRFFPKWNVLQKDPKNKNAFRWKGDIERASMNTPIQGCNADIIKKALIDTQNEIDCNKWDAKIILSVYDELQVEVKESQAEAFKDVLESTMINAAKTVIKTVPIEAECKVSDYWTK